MKTPRLLCSILLVGIGFQVPALAQDFKSDVEALIRRSCIDCHDASSSTGLDFDSLGHDLSDRETFDHWVKIFDRIESGEMPPASQDRPDPDLKKRGLQWLKNSLRKSNLERRSETGRVTAQRLTKLELDYTLKDLFSIEAPITNGVPDEIDAGTFDTVGSNQRISNIHLESYLDAADKAIEAAIRLDKNPYYSFDMASTNFSFLDQWHEKPLDQGGSITRKHDSGTDVILFHDIDYLTAFTFAVAKAGRYRLTATVEAYQSKDPLTAKIIIKGPSGSATLAKSADVTPGKRSEISVEVYLEVGDKPYLTFRNPTDALVYLTPGGSKNYKGPGLAIFSQKIEGPLSDSWPPKSTKDLLGDRIKKGIWQNNLKR